MFWLRNKKIIFPKAIGKKIFVMKICLYLNLWCQNLKLVHILYDFLGTVKEAPHECVIRTGQP